MIYTIDNPKLVENFRNPEEDNFTGVVKDKYGHIAYYEDGGYHRIDGPTIIWIDGSKEWRIHNELHREDGPAVEWKDGKYWYYNGKYHGENDEFTTESWIKKWKLEIFK